MGTEPADPQAIANHLRSWAVKGFYLAFMLAIVPGGFGDFIRADTAALFDDPVALANWLITFMFVVDVRFATVGYMLPMRPLHEIGRASSRERVGRSVLISVVAV